MEDLKLLVMAAKSAGIKHVNYEGVDYDGSAGLVIVGEHGQHLHGWNPLSDDADALRLAVSQHVQITPGITRCHAHIYGQETICVEYPGEENGRNTALSAMTAIRRAIVLAVVGPQS